MSTYLVTGAAGFIGSKVCELLLAEGHTVVGIDNLNDYYDVRLKDYRLAGLLGLRAGNAEKLKTEKLTFEGARRNGDATSKTEKLTSEVWRPGNDPKVSIYAGRGRLEGKMLKAEMLKTERLSALDFSLSAPAARFVFEPLDVENLAGLEALFAEFKFEAVFNIAARAGVRYSMEHPHVYMTTNAHGTLNLLECQRKHGVKKHVLASTSSLYAGCPMPFTEDQPVNTPLSPYAATKKAAEMMAYSYHKLYGIDVSVVRYFTVFGPAGRPDMAPYRFVHWIATGVPIKLFGDGNQTRDFTYVDDIARGTILAARVGKAETLKTEKLKSGGAERGDTAGLKAETLKADGARERGEGRTAGAARSGAEGEEQREPASGAATSKSESAAHSGYDGARERGDGITAGNALERSGRGTADGHPSGGSSYNVINIGGGNRPITINAMIALIERELNEQSAVLAGPSQVAGISSQRSTLNAQLSSFRAVIDRQPPNPVDMTDTSADISKARRLLGWSPEISPEEGFKRTVGWYLENRDWLAAVEV